MGAMTSQLNIYSINKILQTIKGEKKCCICYRIGYGCKLTDKFANKQEIVKKTPGTCPGSLEGGKRIRQKKQKIN
jgi:hypothetical protein